MFLIITLTAETHLADKLILKWCTLKKTSFCLTLLVFIPYENRKKVLIFILYNTEEE